MSTILKTSKTGSQNQDLTLKTSTMNLQTLARGFVPVVCVSGWRCRRLPSLLHGLLVSVRRSLLIRGTLSKTPQVLEPVVVLRENWQSLFTAPEIVKNPCFLKTLRSFGSV